MNETVDQQQPGAGLTDAELHRWWDSAVPHMAQEVRPFALNAEGTLFVRCWNPAYKRLALDLGQVLMTTLPRDTVPPGFDPRAVDLMHAFDEDHCPRTAAWARRAEQALVPVRRWSAQ